MKWPNNAQAPVLFYIDDLCNKWIDTNGDGKLTPENDWGYGGLEPNGVYQFLEREILSINPQIKATFFVPVGKRAPIILNSSLRSCAYPMNYNQKSRDFFSHIHNETHHELAYHGLTHGNPGKTTGDFIQEWLSYKDLKEAVDTIKEGREIFKDTVGVYPRGGKYCGYQSNEFSDQSIADAGFDWWCRFYNRGVETKMDRFFTGEDVNPLTNFRITKFQTGDVVDIPTSLHGGLFNIAKSINPLKRLKKLLKKNKIVRQNMESIKYLLDEGLIISVQEHISASRVDGRRQTPNLLDDLESLKQIFSILKKQNVWYCTGSELFEWIKENGY
jgi:hypothetical protein